MLTHGNAGRRKGTRIGGEDDRGRRSRRRGRRGGTKRGERRGLYIAVKMDKYMEVIHIPLDLFLV